MAGTNAFQVEGVVIEALANGTYRVELANGHRLTGFLTGKAKLAQPRFTPGARVNLELSPYDLSQGRIVVATQKI